jgi:hypothetical protein
MTRPALAIATALIAATSPTNGAEAGGLRLGFGMPLGTFVASPFAPGSVHQPRHSSGYNKLQQQREANVRAAKIANAKREYAAKQEAEARRQAVARAETADKAQVKNAEITTAKVETSTATTEAAPMIKIPDAPVNVAAPAAASYAEVAKVGVIDDAVRIAAPKTAALQQVVTIEKEPASTTTVADKVDAEPTKVADTAQRICRRFSAVIGGLVDIPCE